MPFSIPSDQNVQIGHGMLGVFAGLLVTDDLGVSGNLGQGS